MLRWLRKAIWGSGIRAWTVGRDSLRYMANGRLMTIAGELLNDGFQVYVASIIAWDDSNGELIDEAEKRRILANVVAYLEAKGERVELA